MEKIFFGFGFLLFDLHIPFGLISVNIIPDFVGGILILKGIKEVSDASMRFEEIVSVTKVYTWYSGITMVFDTFFGMGSLYLVHSAIAIIFPLGIAYNIIDGIKEMESKKGYLLQVKKAEVFWWAILVQELIFFVINLSIKFDWMARSTLTQKLIIMGTWVLLIGLVPITKGLFMFVFYKTQKAYYKEVADAH